MLSRPSPAREGLQVEGCSLFSTGDGGLPWWFTLLETTLVCVGAAVQSHVTLALRLPQQTSLWPGSSPLQLARQVRAALPTALPNVGHAAACRLTCQKASL